MTGFKRRLDENFESITVHAVSWANTRLSWFENESTPGTKSGVLK